MVSSNGPIEYVVQIKLSREIVDELTEERHERSHSLRYIDSLIAKYDMSIKQLKEDLKR